MKNFNDELNSLMAMAQNDMSEDLALETKLDEGFYDRVRMPKRFRGVTFDTHPNKATERVKQFCTKKGGGILMLIGPVGTGKTETACCSFVERAKNGLPVGEYYNAQYELCPMYRSTRLSNSNMTEWQFFEHLHKLPFMVIDELGRGDEKEIEKRILQNIFTCAYDNDTKIICTTNMDQKSISEFLGDRLTDRFRQIAEICVLDGNSWRG